MKLKLNLDLAAALRAGHNASTATILLDVEPSSLHPLHRDYIAALALPQEDHLDLTQLGIQMDEPVPTRQLIAKIQDSKVMNTYSNGNPQPLPRLIRPDVEGLTAMLDELVEKHQAHLAANEAKAKAKAEEDAKAKALADARLAECIALAERDPLRVVSFGSYGITEKYEGRSEAEAAEHLAASGRALEVYRFDFDLMPKDLQTAIRDAAQRVIAGAKAIREQLKAEQVAKLLQYMDAEEKAMHERGLYDLRKVEERLVKQAVQALRDKIEPPVLEVEECHQYVPASLMLSRVAWRKLRTIETRLGCTCQPAADGWVNTSTTTADGREVKVSLRIA